MILFEDDCYLIMKDSDKIKIFAKAYQVQHKDKESLLKMGEYDVLSDMSDLIEYLVKRTKPDEES